MPSTQKRKRACAEKLRIQSKRYLESSFRSFLSKAVSVLKQQDRTTSRDNNIDLAFVLELLEQQAGLCAISGIKLTHCYRRLNSVSIDRIDSSIGHVKGNVQLVCRFVNHGKGNLPDGECRALISEIELNLLRKLKQQGYLVGLGPR